MIFRRSLHNFMPIIAAALLASLSGCATLLGNVKPVDQKSEQYGVADLSRSNSEWTRVDSGNPPENTNVPSEISDVAFQSKRTASIISLNSACRTGRETEERDLRTVTNLLFLGITDVSLRSERNVSVQETPALETTVQGKMNGQDMMLRAVVLRRGSCIYDLMYLARPNFFPVHEADFSQFVASLRLKD